MAQSIWIQDVTFYGQAGYRHLLMAGVYEKFPKLKHILTESGCYWVPEVLKQLDRAYYAIKAGALGEMNYAGMESPLKEPPSVYAKRHCYYGASFPSKADLAGIDEIGEDHVLWGMLLLVIVFHGPGRISLDHWINGKLQETASPV